MSNKCTLLLSSCDAYSDIWELFFKVLSIEWPDMPFDVVINTETKKFTYGNYDIKCYSIRNKKIGWGGRLKEILKQIESEFVLIFLEDFFLHDKVDTKKIYQCVEWMEQNKNISVFSFAESQDERNIVSKKYLGFEKRPLFASYKFNCQVALWRRKHLIQYLRRTESPWEWELYGNRRSYRFLNREFYSLCRNEPEIIPYYYSRINKSYKWSLLCKGKWYYPLAQYYNDKYGLQIDLNKRGYFMDFMEINNSNAKENIFMNFIHLFRWVYVPIIKIFNAFYNLKYWI